MANVPMQSVDDIKVGDTVVCNPFFNFKDDEVIMMNGGHVGTSLSMIFIGESKVLRINPNSRSIRIEDKTLNYARNQLLVKGVDYNVE